MIASPRPCPECAAPLPPRYRICDSCLEKRHAAKRAEAAVTAKTQKTTQKAAPAPESSNPGEILVAFRGPFSWTGASDCPSVYDVAESRAFGIYLFTVPLPEGYLIYYVGETGSSFRERLPEHRREHYRATYEVCSAAGLARGERVVLWPGHFGRNRKPLEECLANRERLSEPIREMISIFRLFLAPLSCDTRLRRRIEAAIAHSVRGVPGNIGAFQDPGVRHRPKKENEEPIECVASSPVSLLGLPERFLA